MGKKYIISLHGSYFVNNYGDILLINIFYDWIHKTFPSLLVNLPLVNKNKINEMPEPTCTGILNLLKSVCLVYCGGGYFGETPYHKLRWSIRAFFRHITIGIIAIIFKIPIAILGVEIGPLSIRWFRSVVLWVVRHSKIVLVRNQESYDFLIKHKIYHVRLAADAVLTLNQPDSNRASINYKRDNLAPYIVFHIPGYVNYPTEINSFVIALCESLHCVNKQPQILFVEDTYGQYGPGYEALFKIITDNGFDCSVQQYTGIDSVLQAVANASAVFTTKLHVGITAAAYNKKVFSLYTHPKTARFHQQIGNAFCLPLNRINEKLDLKSLLNKFFESDEPALSSPVFLMAKNNESKLDAFIKSTIPAQ